MNGSPLVTTTANRTRVKEEDQYEKNLDVDIIRGDGRRRDDQNLSENN